MQFNKKQNKQFLSLYGKSNQRTSVLLLVFPFSVSLSHTIYVWHLSLFNCPLTSTMQHKQKCTGNPQQFIMFSEFTFGPLLMCCAPRYSPGSISDTGFCHCFVLYYGAYSVFGIVQQAFPLLFCFLHLTLSSISWQRALKASYKVSSKALSCESLWHSLLPYIEIERYAIRKFSYETSTVYIFQKLSMLDRTKH